MHLPWLYKNGRLYSKMGLIDGEKKEFIFSAVPLLILSGMGIYPDIGPFWLKMFKKINGFVALFNSIHLLMMTSVRLYLTRHDIQLMGDSFYLFILSAHCIYAQLLIRFKQNKISKLFQYMETNLDVWPKRKVNEYPPPLSLKEIYEKGLRYPSKDQSHPGEAYLIYTALWNNRAILMYSITSITISSMYPFIPIFKKSENRERLLPHGGVYLVNEQESPWYELIYIFLTYGAWVNACFVPIIDSVVMIGFCRYISAQYQILRLHLESMNDSSHDYDFRKELIKAIYHHRNIIKFGDLFEDIFNKYLLYIYLVWTLLIAFLLFQMSMLDIYSMECITIIFVMLTAIFNLFIICYFPHIATEQSDFLTSSLYFTDWENNSRENKTIINILYCRFRRPFYITTGKFFNISLDIWTGVIKEAYSFYTLMSQLGD